MGLHQPHRHVHTHGTSEDTGPILGALYPPAEVTAFGMSSEYMSLCTVGILSGVLCQEIICIHIWLESTSTLYKDTAFSFELAM